MSVELKDIPHPRLNSRVVGNLAVEQKLASWACSGRIPQSLLFAGQEGIGKATLAYKFATYLLAGCPDATEEDPLAVDINSAIAGRIAGGSHADLLAIEPEYDEKKQRYKDIIKVDAIRKIQGLTGQTSAEAGWRVVIIDAIDALNPQAANALLKLLEEPPKGVLLILISHNPEQLLPTIRSRCVKVPVLSLSSDRFEQAMDYLDFSSDTSTRLDLFQLSDGSPGLAWQYEAMQVPEFLAYWQSLTRASATERDRQAALQAISKHPALQSNRIMQRVWYVLMRDQIHDKNSQQLLERGQRLLSDMQNIYLSPKHVTAAMLDAITGAQPLTDIAG